MEMLVALAVFAVLAVIASQSLSVIAAGYGRAHEAYRDQESRVRYSRLMERAVTTGAEVVRADDVTGAGPNGQPDRGANLSLIREGAQSVLVWRQASGREDRVLLGVGDFELRVDAEAPGGMLVVLVETSGDGDHVVAMARTLTNAPKDCRFEAVGRRCLEAGR
tara:strand:- start:41988 stop:42479 length:492 start_codon:yes stop_codon:yes gene_type:complete